MQFEAEPRPDPSLEALAERLRALPELSVPANLESRLLAAISVARPARVSPVAAEAPTDRQAWFALASTVLALAMVGLLAVFAWRPRNDDGLVSLTNTSPPTAGNSLPASDEWTGIGMSPIDQHMLSASNLSAFRWPVLETPTKVSSTIPGNLLD